MHISEGILSLPVLVSGAIISGTGTYIGLKDLKYEEYPKIALLTSSFFVASLIHVPIGSTSVHLVLNGLLGILCGWKSFPSILIALFLQGVIFQFGGLTTLGINTANMAIPAVLSYYLFRPLLKRNIFLSGFLSGFFSIIFSCFLVCFSLYLTEYYFLNMAKMFFISHFPVALIEGIITGLILRFLKKANLI
ncbi:MAG: cobalt transporter CbiM [bacterium]|nr:cobalt transporter CbiM [bacterium]